MKQSILKVVLILLLAMVAWFVPFATDAAHSWGREGPLLDGISESQFAAYRSAYGYSGGGYCGPWRQGPPVYGSGFRGAAPAVRHPRAYPGPGYGDCQ